MVLKIVNVESAFGQTGYFINSTFIPVPVVTKIETVNGIYIAENRVYSGEGKTEEGINFLLLNATFEDNVKITIVKNSSLTILGSNFGKNCNFYLDETAILALNDKFESEDSEYNFSNKPNIFADDIIFKVEGGYFIVEGEIISSTDINFVINSQSKANFNLIYLTDFEQNLNQNKIIIECDTNATILTPPVNINYLIKK